MTKAVNTFYDPVSGETITIVFMDMEIGVKGQTARVRPGGTFTIFINLQYDDETQKEALAHELDHIRNGDFDKGGSVQVIEANAHGLDLGDQPLTQDEERYRKARERIGKMLKRERKKAEKERKKQEERNELLAHFGLEEVYVEAGPECGGMRIVKTTRKKQTWDD